MNRYERDHILALGLTLDLLYEVKRLGEGTWIYSLAERGPGASLKSPGRLVHRPGGMSDPA